MLTWPSDIFFANTGLAIGIGDCTIAPRLAGSHSLVVFPPAEPAPPGEQL